MKNIGFDEELRGHSGCVNRLAWNESGTLLASVSDDTNIMLWPFPKGEPYKVPTLHTNNVFGISFLPQSNSSTLVTGSLDSCVSLHRIAEAGGALEAAGDSRTEVHHIVAHTATFRCHEACVNDVEVSQHEPNLAWSASSDGSIRQFDFRMPKSQQDTPGSPNVLVYSKPISNTAYISEYLMEVGFTSVRVNPVRPEMLAVGGHTEDVLLFDRRKTGLTSRDMSCQPRSHGIVNTDPLLTLYFPFDSVADAQDVEVHPTYVSFGNRGDRLVATYHKGPAVAWSTFNSDTSVVTSFERQFDIERSMSEMEFFGNENFTDPATARCILEKCSTREANNHGKDYLRRMLKKALAEDPYNHAIHEALIGTYLDDDTSLEYPLRSLLHAECCLRIAPPYLFEPYFYVLMSLDKANLPLASLYMFHHVHRKFDGKSREYYDAKSRGEYQMLKAKLEEDVEVLYSSSNIGRLMAAALAGDVDIDHWMSKILHRPYDPIPPHHVRAQLAYIKACGISYREKKPMPLFTLGYLQQNFLQSYSYHSNCATGIKEAVFLGTEDSHIVCASDSGLTIVYEAGSGEVSQIFRGDSQVCNCIRPHPTMPIIATSGLDSSVKIWSTDWYKSHMSPRRSEGMQEETLTHVSLLEQRSLRSLGRGTDFTRSPETLEAMERFYQGLIDNGDTDLRMRLSEEITTLLEDEYLNPGLGVYPTDSEEEYRGLEEDEYEEESEEDSGEFHGIPYVDLALESGMNLNVNLDTEEYEVVYNMMNDNHEYSDEYSSEYSDDYSDDYSDSDSISYL